MHRPLRKQITIRIGAALLAAACVVVGATYVLHGRALDHARKARQSENAKHFRESFANLHQLWDQTAHEISTSIEFAGVLAQPARRKDRLTAYLLSLNSGGMQFSGAVVADNRGRPLVLAGSLPNIPPSLLSSRLSWFFDDAQGVLYHIVRHQLWLGGGGRGTLVLFRPLDNALLRDQSFPDTDLLLLWNGRPVASSLGQAGIERFAEPGAVRDREGAHIVSNETIWNDAGRTPGPAPVLLARTHLTEPLSLVEAMLITFGAIAMMSLIVRFLLGTWLGRVAKRIDALREKTLAFTRERNVPTAFLPEAGTGGEVQDELGALGSAFGDMLDTIVKAEEILQESEEKFKSIFNNATDGIIIADPQTKRFVTVSATMARMLGYRSEELEVMGVADIHPAASLADVASCFEKSARGEERYFDNIPVLRKDGSVFPAEVAVSWIRLKGVDYLVGFFRDVTERTLAEVRLRELDRRQKAILNNIPDMAWLKDRESRFLAVNEPFGKACGRPPDELVGKTDLNIWPAELADKYLADDRAVMKLGVRKQVEEPLVGSDGKERWIETIKTPIMNDQGEVIGTTGIARDITERKRVEEELLLAKQFSDSLINTANVIVVVLNKRGEVLQVNDTGEQVTGYSQQEILGRSWFETLVPRERYPEVWDEFTRLTTKSFISTFTNPIMRKDGTERTITWKNSVLGTDKGIVTVSFGIDITEQKLAEERIAASLREKETLLKEVHHRVKNNLQIIASLLYLQAEQITDPAVLDVLMESRDRIRSLALVHEKLYGAGDLSRVDLMSYLDDLLAYLSHAHGTAGRGITVAACIENLYLNIDQAVPCGILLNELITNAFKHAFPGRKEGRIEIAASIDDKNVVHLTLKDDGIGFPDGFTADTQSSLGLRLVQNLVRQLRGTLAMRSEKGAEIVVTFPVSDPVDGGIADAG